MRKIFDFYSYFARFCKDKNIFAMLQTRTSFSYKSGLMFEKKKKKISKFFEEKKKVCHVTDFDQLLLENPYDF
jgi:hypothetical protein